MESQRDTETYAIIGAAMEVHKVLGHGFLENIYHHALCIELASRSISFKREHPINIAYKGTPLACQYKADLICNERVLVEPKAISHLSDLTKRKF